MKKIVLTFGLIAGAVLSVMLVLQMAFKDEIGFDRGLIVGYTSIVLAFMLIYFGVRSYRDNVAGGTVRFGRAFAVGILIAVVASLVEVVTWQIIHERMAPDYLEKYKVHMLDKARREGESEEEIAKKKAEMEEFEVQYRNPLVKAAFTFMEPFPVGVVIALVSAGVVSRQRSARHLGKDVTA